MRFAVLQRDNFTCRYCGAAAPDVSLHIDHRIAVANGGTNDVENLVTACADCNLGKSDLLLRPAIENQYEVALAASMMDAAFRRFRREMPDDAFFILQNFALSEPDTSRMLSAIDTASSWREGVARLYQLGGYPPRFWAPVLVRYQ